MMQLDASDIRTATALERRVGLFSLKVVQYRENARNYRMFASQAWDELEKRQLLNWAEAWEKLASQREQRIARSHGRSLSAECRTAPRRDR